MAAAPCFTRKQKKRYISSCPHEIGRNETKEDSARSWRGNRALRGDGGPARESILAENRTVIEEGRCVRQLDYRVQPFSA